MYKYELKDAINICKKAYSDRVILIVGSFYVYKTVCEVLKMIKLEEVNFKYKMVKKY